LPTLVSGVLPADERLYRGETLVAHRDHRLIDEAQLLTLETGAQVGLEPYAIEQRDRAAGSIVVEVTKVVGDRTRGGDSEIRIPPRRIASPSTICASLSSALMT
jgi:hypothetical protein